VRVGRLAFELLLVIALAGAALIIWAQANRARNPFLPRYGFTYDQQAGSVYVQGTWTLEDEQIASPNQTTTVLCTRSTMQCFEATAVMAELSGDAFLLPVDINPLKVLRWDSDLVLARGQTALCVDTTVNIFVPTKTVTGLVTPRDGCADLAKQKRLRMIDGYEASWTAHGYSKFGVR
jgi:hypothetical protein